MVMNNEKNDMKTCIRWITNVMIRCFEFFYVRKIKNAAKCKNTTFAGVLHETSCINSKWKVWFANPLLLVSHFALRISFLLPLADEMLIHGKWLTKISIYSSYINRKPWKFNPEDNIDFTT